MGSVSVLGGGNPYLLGEDRTSGVIIVIAPGNDQI